MLVSFVGLLLAMNPLSGQQTDTLGNSIVLATPDSVPVKGDLLLVDRTYEPRKALLWALIPGGGQVYNRRWWKVPLVFGGFTSVLAVLEYNQTNYQRFKRAYDQKLAGNEHEFSGTIIDDERRLLNFRNQFNKGRQSAYFYLIGLYLAQGVEAYVDAHLRNFDIDEDLSLRPALVPAGPGGAPSLALGITYCF
ncbi:MAG: hypothetical protein D6772_16360 [Bacteroidetes bacterium]|nr:MAG: hypothetical protein D6772_16360 [Bacteroidota bacterium]